MCEKKFKEKSYECACFRKGRDDDIALQDWRVKRHLAKTTQEISLVWDMGYILKNGLLR